MNIVVVCGMSDEKVHARLLPLVELEEIEKIYLVRRKPILMPKVISLSLPAWVQRILVVAELYRFFALLWICLLRKPNVLYGIYFVPHGIYAAIAGWLFHIPVIQELIGTDRLKIMNSKFLLWLLKTADHIFVRGNTSKQQLMSIGIQEEKLLISNAVNVLDFDHFKPDGSRKIYDLIYSGRMDKNKQLDILIRAVSALVKSHPGITMVFVGDGPERYNLEALTEGLGLASTITFVGIQTYERIPYFLNQSKVFVMSSAFEGLPVAMLEALSCGLPVIVPDVGDIADLAVHQVNAFLVDQVSPDAFVEAVKNVIFIDDCYRKLVNGALETRRRLQAAYTLDRASADFLQILENFTR